MKTEYDAFQVLTNSLEAAASAASEVARHRPDHSRQWEKVAEALRVVKESVYRLAAEGVVKGQH